MGRGIPGLREKQLLPTTDGGSVRGRSGGKRRPPGQNVNNLEWRSGEGGGHETRYILSHHAGQLDNSVRDSKG